MKIFNWVHRKFRQNSKDSGQGTGAGRDRVAEERFEDDDGDGGGGGGTSARKWSHSHSPRRMSPSPKEKEREITDDRRLQIHRHNTLTLTAATAFNQLEVEGEHWPLSVAGESVTDEQVRSLLTIGTLGLERMNEVAEEELLESKVERVDSDVTAGDVELFHDELQKVFGLKSHDQLNPESSSSLSLPPPLQLHGNSSNVNDLYPLHQFFLNSSQSAIPIGSNNQRHHKKEDKSAPRTSLRDLFSTATNKHEDQEAGARDSKGNEYNIIAEEAKKSGGRLSSFVKKVVKGAGKTHTASVSGEAGQVDSRCKVEKVMQGLFHRRIYPEHSAPTHTVDTAVVRAPRARAKKKCRLTSCIIPPKLNDHDHDHDHSIIVTANSKCNHPQLVCSREGLCAAHEHWINTDANYVVLEF